MTVTLEHRHLLESDRFYKQIDAMPLEDVVKLMRDLRSELDTVSAIKSLYEKAHDHLRLNKIPDLMDERGVTSLTLAGIGRVTLTSDLRARIAAADRERAYAWLEENGYGDLIKETVNAGTLKSFCKRRIKDGKELPDDLFKVQPFSRASITKVR